MPDWEQLVRDRLPLPKLPGQTREEIISELASHLEEIYQQNVVRLANEHDAVEHTLREAGDWSVLAENIANITGKRKLMNLRTRALWLPALATLLAASLFLRLLTEISLEPRFLVRLTGLGPWFYSCWLLANLLFGSLGAFLSGRAGGSRRERLVAGVFPALVMFGLCAVAIPVSVAVDRNPVVLHHPWYLAVGVVVWVVAPGTALLLGAMPFLRKTNLSVA